MRSSCLFCVCKHLAQAQVLYLESFKGYSIHKWLAIGHLAEAEDEAIDSFPEIAENVREIRLKMMGQKDGEVSAGEIIRCLKKGVSLLEKDKEKNGTDKKAGKPATTKSNK